MKIKLLTLCLTLLICTAVTEKFINAHSMVIPAAIAPPSPFVGKWLWKDDKDPKNYFRLTIKQLGGSLIGNYCCAMESGKKMDCSTDPRNVSFTTPLPDVDQFVIFTFYSNLTQSIGRARLTLDGKNLTWEVTGPPQKEYYCPKKATLVKVKKF